MSGDKSAVDSRPNGLSYLTRLPDDNLSIALEQNFYEAYTKKWIKFINKISMKNHIWSGNNYVHWLPGIKKPSNYGRGEFGLWRTFQIEC